MNEHIILIVSELTAWTIGIVLVIWEYSKWERYSPKCITEQGTKIVFNTYVLLPNYIKKHMEKAINLFIEYVTEHTDTNKDELNKLFSNITVIIHQKPIIYKKKKFNGLTIPGIIQINWLEGCGTNAFFHECIHRLRQDVWKLERDDEHKAENIWHIPKILKQKFKN